MAPVPHVHQRFQERVYHKSTAPGSVLYYYDKESLFPMQLSV